MKNNKKFFKTMIFSIVGILTAYSIWWLPVSGRAWYIAFSIISVIIIASVFIAEIYTLYTLIKENKTNKI